MEGFSSGSGPLSPGGGGSVGRTCYYCAQSDGNVCMILSVSHDLKNVLLRDTLRSCAGVLVFIAGYFFQQNAKEFSAPCCEEGAFDFFAP